MWRFFKIPILITVSALIVLGVSVALNPNWLRIESIEIGLQDDSSENVLFQRIKDKMDPSLQKLTGEYFWNVPLERVYEVVNLDKRVRTISIYREFPNRIRVEIVPHTPVMAYFSSDGRFYPVALDATLLPALATGEFPDMPILRGEALKDDPQLRMAAIELFNSLKEEGSFKKSAVSEIIYGAKDGFRIFLTNNSGEIKLGDSDFGPKLSRVQKVLSYLESQNVKGRVIDARFSKKVVVRVRNSP